MSYIHLLTDVPQTEPLNLRQVRGEAGGCVFPVDDWTRLDRFLVIGSSEPTFYVSARKLTRENAAAVERCYAADPERTVARIVEVSEAGRAPRNDPAILALALGAIHPDTSTRQRALAAMPRVCRTASHLFQFVATARALGKGWGRAMKRAVANWYDAKPIDDLAYQAIKYRSREGYSHKRLLQTAHPKGDDDDPRRKALYQWMVGRLNEVEARELLPGAVRAHLEAMLATKADTVRPASARLAPLIETYRLPWEALPTWANADPAVWRAMLPHLGLTALIRNLGNMTRIGAVAPLSPAEAFVVVRLGDERAIRKARVHPFAILQAMSVYSSGQGHKGSGTWTPSRPVLDALDGAFYTAFANVEPTGKRILIALDVSASMTAPLMGSMLSCRAASAALALVTMATEPQTHVVGFTALHGSLASPRVRSALTPLAISPRQRLTDAVKAVSDLPFGGTDCALPMLHAAEKGLAVDAVVIMTDSETWAGAIHPMEALRRYRAKSGIPAKLVVVGLTSSGFSIADPLDGGALDVCGFDASAPSVIADFIRGRPH